MDISGFFRNIVSITQFNKGQASPLFSRAQKGETLLVIKNNMPMAVILSPEEYELLRALPKACKRMIETSSSGSPEEIEILISRLESYDKNGEFHV